MSADPAISVRALRKSYKDVEVLRGVDFDVTRGSVFALLGSNGAGETTIVRILSTLTDADTGTASVNGFDVSRQAGHVRESISLTGQFAARRRRPHRAREPDAHRAAASSAEPRRHPPTTSFVASSSTRPRSARYPPTPAACDGDWTSL